MWNRIVASIKWVRAIDLASKHQYRDALDDLDMISQFHLRNPEYFLLRGVVEICLEKYAESADDLVEAKSLIAESKRFNQDEKKYLTVFADRLLPPSKRDLNPLKSDPTQNLRFDASNVAKRLKGIFPLKSL